jgi:hypothetical protein
MAISQHPEPARAATRGPATLGALALVMAVVTIALFRIAARLVSVVAPGIFAGSGGPGWSTWAEAACMSVAVLTGLVALLTGRGRGFAVAAILLAIAGSGLVDEAILAVLPPYRYH